MQRHDGHINTPPHFLMIDDTRFSTRMMARCFTARLSTAHGRRSASIAVAMMLWVGGALPLYYFYARRAALAYYTLPPRAGHDAADAFGPASSPPAMPPQAFTRAHDDGAMERPHFTNTTFSHFGVTFRLPGHFTYATGRDKWRRIWLLRRRQRAWQAQRRKQR